VLLRSFPYFARLAFHISPVCPPIFTFVLHVVVMNCHHRVPCHLEFRPRRHMPKSTMVMVQLFSLEDDLSSVKWYTSSTQPTDNVCQAASPSADKSPARDTTVGKMTTFISKSGHFSIGMKVDSNHFARATWMSMVTRRTLSLETQQTLPPKHGKDRG
jgi:hypothetical protein